MKQGNGFLYHSIISPYLNIGLLTAREICERAGADWVKTSTGYGFVKQPDGSYLATGTNPQKDVYIYDAPLPEEGASAFLLECLTDPSLPGGGAGRYSNSNFALSAFDVYVRHANGKQELLPLKKAEADFSQKGYEIANVPASAPV